MKRTAALAVTLAALLIGVASGQDMWEKMQQSKMAAAPGKLQPPASQGKPRVFVAGRGTLNTTTNAESSGDHSFRQFHAATTHDAHDESMEVMKDLQKECPGVMMTLDQSKADYVVMLNRESKRKELGALKHNSQMLVANSAGDVLGANNTRTVNNASKNACSLILSDWEEHAPVRTAVTK
jgi:hypothetical protein